MGNGNACASRTISEWSQDFAKLYDRPNRFRTPEGLWMGAVAHCSQIGEAIRRADYNALIGSACHAFCWILSFLTKCNSGDDPLFHCGNGMSEIVYFKFPGLCGHCLDRHCTCDPVKTDKKTNKAAQYSALYTYWHRAKYHLKYLDNYDIGLWVDEFSDIFGGRIHLQTLDSIGFHFLEEVGEEAQAIQKLIQLRGVIDSYHNSTRELLGRYCAELSTIDGLVKEYAGCEKSDEGKPRFDKASRDVTQVKARILDAKMDLVIELADTFSWFCAVLIKLRQMPQPSTPTGGSNVTLDIEYRLQQEYGAAGAPLVCASCRTAACECAFYTPSAAGDDYLVVAREAARHSSCLLRQYGAVLVKNGQILSTGCNGSAHGTLPCLEIGKCARGGKTRKTGEHYELCRAVHAEQNALLSPHRSEMEGATLYLVAVDRRRGGKLLDARPCAGCRRLMMNAKIESVVLQTAEGETRTERVAAWANE